MAEYDGWVIKNFNARNPWLLLSTFHRKRTDVIRHFDSTWWATGIWKKERRKGNFKIVKVKLVEVE